ncbi:MAG: hypothetical protein ACRCSF_12180 [Mycobacteriaceae bacterium]
MNKKKIGAIVFIGVTVLVSVVACFILRELSRADHDALATLDAEAEAQMIVAGLNAGDLKKVGLMEVRIVDNLPELQKAELLAERNLQQAQLKKSFPGTGCVFEISSVQDEGEGKAISSYGSLRKTRYLSIDMYEKCQQEMKPVRLIVSFTPDMGSWEPEALVINR